MRWQFLQVTLRFQCANPPKINSRPHKDLCFTRKAPSCFGRVPSFQCSFTSLIIGSRILPSKSLCRMRHRSGALPVHLVPHRPCLTLCTCGQYTRPVAASAYAVLFDIRSFHFPLCNDSILVHLNTSVKHYFNTAPYSYNTYNYNTVSVWWTHLAYLGVPSVMFPCGATTPDSRSILGAVFAARVPVSDLNPQ